jgi:hypothetical protein
VQGGTHVTKYWMVRGLVRPREIGTVVWDRRCAGIGGLMGERVARGHLI